MKYLALFKDSLVEAFDRRTMHVLIALSLLLVLVLAGVRLPKIAGEALVVETVETLGIIHSETFFGPQDLAIARVFPDVAGLQPIEPRGEPFKIGYSFTLRFPRRKVIQRRGAEHVDATLGNFLAAVRAQAEYRRSHKLEFEPALHKWETEERDSGWVVVHRVGETVEELAIPNVDEVIGHVDDFLKRHGFEWTQVSAPEDDGVALVMRVRCGTFYPYELNDVRQVGLLFGAVTVPLPWTTSVATAVFVIEQVLVDWIAGVVGIFLALLVSASVIPDMLKRGALDLLVTKPISRPLLYVYKVLGASLFVLVNSIVLVGGAWLALSAATGYFNPWFLCSIGVLVFFFLTLYSLSAFVGVVWRNPTVSLVVPLVAWIGLTALSTALTIVEMIDKSGTVSVPAPVAKAVRTLHAVLPKTGDIKEINTVLIAKGMRNVKASPGMAFALKNIRPAEIIVPSLVFMTFFIALGAWVFSRRDY